MSGDTSSGGFYYRGGDIDLDRCAVPKSLMVTPGIEKAEIGTRIDSGFSGVPVMLSISEMGLR